MANGSGNEVGGGSRSNQDSEQEERTDGWMATYSDMVTLLLTFFVLMFAISNVDAQKFALFAAGMSRGGMTEERFGTIMDLYGDIGDTQMGEDEDEDITDEPGSQEPSELDILAALITSYINENGLWDIINLVYNGDFLLFTLASDIWFATGSAVITEEMREYAEVLGALLADTQNDDRPFEIVVAGHTDNVPISTAFYRSNWYLSMDRAANFISILINESRLNEGYFSARGYGDTRPVNPNADNDLPENRSLNRRVEVMISMLRETESSIPR